VLKTLLVTSLHLPNLIVSQGTKANTPETFSLSNLTPHIILVNSQ